MNEQLLMKLYKIINTVIKDKNLPACLLENISSCQFPSMTYSTIYLINISVYPIVAQNLIRERKQDHDPEIAATRVDSWFLSLIFFFFSSSFYPFSHRRGYATSTQRYDTNIYKQLSLPFISKMADTTSERQLLPAIFRFEPTKEKFLK